MLKLLLDEHVSPDIAKGLRHRNKHVVIYSLAEWEEGCFLGQPDHLLLEEAAAQNLTLATYDRRTIPPLLKIWAEAGQEHGGVIFVESKTIPASNFGGLIKALQKLVSQSAKWNWKSRVCFLRK